MKRSVLCKALLIAGMVPASAADLPQQKAPVMAYPASSWTGLYIGGNAGYAWEMGGSNFADAPRGPFGGLQIGYDKQSGAWVLGVRADIEAADIRAGGPMGAFTVSSVTDFASTFDGRLGYLISNDAMLYGVGGAAVAVPRISVTDNATFTSAVSTARVGWNIGGGVEMRMAPGSNWTGFVEAGYVDLGSASVGGLSTGRIDFGYGRGGLNYHF